MRVLPTPVRATRAPARESAPLGQRAEIGIAAPVWLWLAGLVLASAVFRYLLARQVLGPWIMIDELVYSELAKSFAATGHFLVRDEHFARYGPVYPAVISPAYRAFTAVPHAYSAAKGINSVVMSLAALPAYAIGRRFLAPRPALLGAALALAVPSLAYTGTLMTENVAYPLVLTAVLALVLTLERPTLVGSLVTLALTFGAIVTRLQAVALLAAIAVAPVLLVLIRRRPRDLVRYAVLYAPLAAAVGAIVAVQLSRGRPITGFLGVYGFVSDLDYDPGAVARWSLYTIADLDLYVGVIPFAAFLVLLPLAARLSLSEQAFLAAAASVTAAFVVEGAAFSAAVGYFHRVPERYSFYPAPLLLLALLLWLSRGSPRPQIPTVAAALVAAALPGVLPFGRLLVASVNSDTLALIPWLEVREHVLGPGGIRLVVIAGCVGAAVLFAVVPRRLAFVLPAAVVAYFALVLVAVQTQFRRQSLASLSVASDRSEPGWLDSALGANANVVAIWSRRTIPGTVWTTEFFNRSVGPVYDLATPLPGALPASPAAIDRATGSLRLRAGGGGVAARYVLVDRSVGIGGLPVATSPGGELTVYRTGGRVRIVSLVDGRYPGGDWFRPLVRYRRFGCTGGTVVAVLATDPAGFPAGETVVSGGAHVHVPPAGIARLGVPLRPRAGVCAAAFRSSPVVRAQPIWGPGAARVGARYLDFSYRP